MLKFSSSMLGKTDHDKQIYCGLDSRITWELNQEIPDTFITQHYVNMLKFTDNLNVDFLKLSNKIKQLKQNIDPDLKPKSILKEHGLIGIDGVYKNWTLDRIINQSTKQEHIEIAQNLKQNEQNKNQLNLLNKIKKSDGRFVFTIHNGLVCLTNSGMSKVNFTIDNFNDVHGLFKKDINVDNLKFDIDTYKRMGYGPIVISRYLPMSVATIKNYEIDFDAISVLLENKDKFPSGTAPETILEFVFNLNYTKTVLEQNKFPCGYSSLSIG